MASALAACDVDFLAATELAYGLAVKHDLYNRRLGLVGVWGGLVREWLDELLPDNAADVCRGKVFVHTWDVPSFSRRPYTDFASKQDLIDCLLASVHIVRPPRPEAPPRRRTDSQNGSSSSSTRAAPQPFFMDGRPVKMVSVRGQPRRASGRLTD